MSQTNNPQEAASSSAAAALSGASGPSVATAESRLEHFPNAFFAMVMGLAGFTLATERLEKSFGMEHSNSLYLLTFTGIVFAILLGIYLLKAIKYPAAISWEWHHPVRLCFFPAASIGLILMGTAFGPFSHALSFGFWAVGSALHLIGTLAVLSTWIGHRNFELMHLNPAWFIPVVGNILVPIAGSRLGYTEISWFFFAIGILFWVVLLTLVFNRLVFHNPLPERLLPTLMILIAPPAVGFVSFVTMTGGIDPFSRILYYTGVFFFLIILLQVPKLSRISFAMSWWAYSFPLAALTISTLLYAEKIQSGIHETIGYGLFALLVLVIIGLLIRTMKAVLGGEICQPE
ncbi:tellurite resistance protein [Cohaesibacter marisflavi]|uniref:Tellurite resistance protein n=1 Tax=Cohaesibacter marisflavi TaxID=655353 RepID=A0A1I4ZYG2_9HYPH|nr:SLAC1 anion channel family protein [Cohaesibacter marisflavi]SFN55242.1 tellurite resistance protein [Cohaesibacter marisflavi]